MVSELANMQLPAGTCTTPPPPTALIAFCIFTESSCDPSQGVLTVITRLPKVNPAPQPTPRENGSPEPDTTVMGRSTWVAPVPLPLSTRITEAEVALNDAGAVTTSMLSL